MFVKLYNKTNIKSPIGFSNKYGIYTRYAHLDTVRVKKGQVVSQRDVIGTLGDSGLAVGAHLHYEVHIGSDVVDPAKYVNIK